MNLNDIINRTHYLPMLPVTLTERSDVKAIRVAGVIVYIFWFFPAALLWIIIAAVLAIPAMIQDA